MPSARSSRPAIVNVHAAKTHFSKLLARVSGGEEILIAKAGKPVARLVPITQSRERKLGTAKGKVWIAADFDAPLPPEVVDLFLKGRLEP